MYRYYMYTALECPKYLEVRILQFTSEVNKTAPNMETKMCSPFGHKVTGVPTNDLFMHVYACACVLACIYPTL